MFKHLVVLFILGITSTFTLAQDFSRNYTVRDSETNNFISGATVSIIDTVNNETFASGVTDNRGQITLNWTIVSNEDEFEIPKDLQVSNVFPNPVVNEANIDLSVSENDEIRVEIFNLLGQRVGTYDQALNAGGYNLLFQVNGLANGTYFARITYNGQVELRKFSYIGGGQGGVSFNGLNRSDLGRFKRAKGQFNASEGVVVRVVKEGYFEFEDSFNGNTSGIKTLRIEQIREAGVVTVADARDYPSGWTVTVSGIITVGNEFQGPVYFQDETAGIAWYSSNMNNPDYINAISRGDSIYITGIMGENNSLIRIENELEVSFESNTIEVIPVEISVAQLNSGSYEGQLVTITGSMNTQTFSTSPQAYTLTDASGSGVLRISNHTNLLGATFNASQYEITGVAGKSAGTNQLLPRAKSDLVKVTEPIYSEFETDNTNFLPGDIQILRVLNATVSVDSTYEVLLSDGTVTEMVANPDSDTELIFTVPVADSGDLTMYYEINGQEQELEFFMEDYQAIEDPLAFTTQFFDSLNTRLTNIIEEVEEGGFQDQVVGLLTNVQLATDTLETMDEAEVALLARVLSRYAEEGERDFYSKVFIANPDTTQCVTPEEIINVDLAYVTDYQSTLNISEEFAELGWGSRVASALLNTADVLHITIIEDAKNNLEYFYGACLSQDDNYGNLALFDNQFNKSDSENRFELREGISQTFFVTGEYSIPWELRQRLDELNGFMTNVGIIIPEIWRSVFFPENYRVNISIDPLNIVVNPFGFFDAEVEVIDSLLSIGFEYDFGSNPLDEVENLTFTVQDTITNRLTFAYGLVKPSFAVSFEDDSSAFMPGEIQAINVTGGFPETDTLDSYYNVELSDGSTADLYLDNANSRFLFTVPEIATGVHQLSFNMEGQDVELEFEVAVYEEILDPQVFLNNSLVDLRTELEETILDLTNSGESAFITDAINSLNELESQLEGLSDAEIALLARFIKTNSESTTSQIESEFQKFNPISIQNACDDLAKTIEDKKKQMLKGTGGLLVMALGVVTIAESVPLGLAAIVVGTTAFYSSRSTLIEALGDFFDCYVPIGQSLELDNDIQFKGLPTAPTVLSESEAFALEHTIEEDFIIKTQSVLPHSVANALAELKEAITNSDIDFPEGWFDFLDVTERLVTETPDQIYVYVDDPYIDGEASVSDSVITVSFMYNDSSYVSTGLTSGNNFTFTLSDSLLESDTESIRASANGILEYPLPVAYDSTITTEEDVTITIDGLNAYFPSRYHILKNPSNGSVNSFGSANGYLRYTPNSGFSGIDTLIYNVSNYRGESDPAQVIIEVIEDSVAYYTNAALGDWTAVNEDGDGEAYIMTLEDDGTFFIVTADGRVFDRSNYQWEIIKSEGKYFMGITGFWHPAFNEFRVVDPSLPNSYLRPGNLSFIWYTDIGEGPKPAIRYTK